MLRPVAGPFQGSMPTEPAADSRFVRLLDLLLGGFAVLAAGLVWVVAPALQHDPDPFMVMKASCVALLLYALPGVYLVRRAQTDSRHRAASFFVALFRRLQQGADAVPLAPAEAGEASMVDLVATLVRQPRGLGGSWRRTAEKANQRLARGRAEADQLVERLRQADAAVNEAAGAVELSETRLADEVAAAGRPFELADDAMSRVVDGAVRLAGSVRATTGAAERMTNLAVRLAEVAHETQKSVASLDDRSAKLTLALDEVALALQLAGTTGETATTTTQAGAVEIVVAELGEMAAKTLVVLQEAVETLRELTSETQAANRRTLEIGELVRSNHDVGQAVNHAVLQQSEDISSLLNDIYEARSGFAELRAGVEAVAAAGTARSGIVQTIRSHTNLLPAHAEIVASLLRNIPDFVPPED